MVLDELRILVWMQTKDGQKGNKRPERSSPLAPKKTKRKWGKTDLPPEQVEAMLHRVARGGQVWKGRPRQQVMS